jgi:hypothetical protein
MSGRGSSERIATLLILCADGLERLLATKRRRVYPSGIPVDELSVIRKVNVAHRVYLVRCRGYEVESCMAAIWSLIIGKSHGGIANRTRR